MHVSYVTCPDSKAGMEAKGLSGGARFQFQNVSFLLNTCNWGVNIFSGRSGDIVRRTMYMKLHIISR